MAALSAETMTSTANTIIASPCCRRFSEAGSLPPRPSSTTTLSVPPRTVMAASATTSSPLGLDVPVRCRVITFGRPSPATAETRPIPEVSPENEPTVAAG
jgi:hypothetical protein